VVCFIQLEGVTKSEPEANTTYDFGAAPSIISSISTRCGAVMGRHRGAARRKLAARYMLNKQETGQ
jgi:hypothetical protein